MAPRRPRKFYVFNATGYPFAFNSAGQLIFPGATREADPEDPVTQLYLGKGYLIQQEG